MATLPLLKMAPRKLISINYIIIDLPAPSNISRVWSFGSLLGLILSIQIVRGTLLSIHYSSDIIAAYERVIHIQREVMGGWIFRTLHRNGASIFFVLLYAHIARGLYYGSYRNKGAWYSGVTLYILRIAIAFIGYLLPWGQISFWGATVITNLFRAIPYIGPSIVSWMWGGFAVGGPTLGRFFTGHFIIPLLMVLIILLHLISLHQEGSRNPLGVHRVYKVIFHPLFTSKDVVGFIIVLAVLSIVVFYNPFILGDPDNWVPANNIVTPTHIKPEWYFLWVYAILRSVPNKLGGVILLVLALISLYALPHKLTSFKARMWYVAVVIIILRWVGTRPVEHPYIIIGALLRLIYFLLLLF